MAEETLGPTEMAAHQSPAQVKLLKYALFVLAGVLLLAGAAGGYWYGTRISNFESQMPKLPIPTQNLTPSRAVFFSPTPNPTANWKTYTNTKYGFSFKYPSGMKIKEVNSANEGYPIVEVSDQDGKSIVISSYNNPKKLTLEEFDQEKNTGLSQSSLNLLN